MQNEQKEPVFIHELTVPVSAIDENGHVNNVVYVQWMQDVAIMHSDATGGTAAMREAGGAWVVRSHQVEYLAPAFAGDVICIRTWVHDFRHVRSLRKYRFENKETGRLIARGETQWVFISPETGRPKSIPDAVQKCFCLKAKS
jgi:acyl-CoA thioester hydrolase